MITGVFMGFDRFRKYGLYLLFCGFIVHYLTGCNRESINLREMSPEEQFAYAKRIFDKKDYYKAKMQFTVVVLNNPGHPIIEKAQFYLGQSHYYEKEYLLAAAEYEKLIQSIPQSPFVDDAQYMVGMCYYQLSPGYALDQEYTYKAITKFQQFLEDYPESEFRPLAEKRLSESVSKLAKKEYKTGELYRKMSMFSSALISFDAVLERYYDTEYADDAQYWKGECHRKMGEWDDAEKAFRDLISKHAQSDWVRKAGKKLEEVIEEREKQSQEDSKEDKQ